MRLKTYMRRLNIERLKKLARVHGHIVGASDDGTLDHVPPFVAESPARLHIGPSWMNGFLEGGEKWMAAHESDKLPA